MQITTGSISATGGSFVAGQGSAFTHTFPEDSQASGTSTVGVRSHQWVGHRGTDKTLLSRSVVEQKSSTAYIPFDSNQQTATNTWLRSHVGGKGMFLQIMAEAGIPVPPFMFVDTDRVAALEQQLVPRQILESYLPAGDLILEQISVAGLLAVIDRNVLSHQRHGWLDGLSKFIASDDFYLRMQSLDIAHDIRELYLDLQKRSNGNAFIVRSSGVEEDRFGDAQAGKYDSRVHNGGDILKTCLGVLASAYRPEVYSDENKGRTKPMALVIQECISCEAGGVVFSHSSLKDDDIVVQFTPGQPGGVVSGVAGNQPHSYHIKRTVNGEPVCQPVREFFPGKVQSQLVLKNLARDNGHIEERVPTTTVAEDAITLPDETLERLQLYTEKLENILCCPVDIEFGLDHQQKLYLFQVRPVTQLPGGTHYADTAPATPLVAGTLVSEGSCSGLAVSTGPLKPEQIAMGAVVFSEYAHDWMLEPAIMERVGGFVFRQGGTNDHVAITLRQADKPCLLAGESFHRALTNTNGTQVTMVVGSFSGHPGAYLLNGDQLAQWQVTSVPVKFDDPCGLIASLHLDDPPDFRRVDEGFAWLNRKNNRLLDYFRSDHLLSRCLRAGNSKALSMSPNRGEVLEEAAREIDRLIEGLQQFYSGYRRFFAIAQATGQQENCRLTEFTCELELLENKLRSLRNEVQTLSGKIVQPLVNNRELPHEPVNFRLWQKDCEILLDTLQSLTRPGSTLGIRSVHDFIFWLHFKFVAALAPVAEASGQGEISTHQISEDSEMTVVSLVSEPALGLLNQACLKMLKNDKLGTIKVLNMDEAAIINLGLGMHVCTIEMLEQGEGGKGRKLCLNFADNFSRVKCEDLHRQGKIKRFWLLVQLLREASIDSHSRPMTVGFNEAAGKVTIECVQFKTTEALREAFAKLLVVLSGLGNMDLLLELLSKENVHLWEFDTLAAQCGKSKDDPSNKWLLRQCLVLDGIGRKWHQRGFADRSFLNYLDLHSRNIYRLAKLVCQMESCLYTEEDPEKEFYLKLAEKTTSLEDEYATRIKKEMLIHLAIADHCPKVMINCLRQHFHLDNDRRLALFMVDQNSWLFRYLSDSFQNDIEIAKTAIRQNGMLLYCASPQLKTEKSSVMLAVNSDGRALEYACEALRNDLDVVLSAYRESSSSFKFAGESLKKNETLLRRLISIDPGEICFASESMREDKDLILSVVAQDGMLLDYASKALKDDVDVVMTAIHGNNLNNRSSNRTPLQFASPELRNNVSIVKAAVKADLHAFNYASEACKCHREVVLEAVKHSDCNLGILSPFADDKGLMAEAFEANQSAIEYASDRLKDDKDFVMPLLLKAPSTVYGNLSPRLKNDPSVRAVMER